MDEYTGVPQVSITFIHLGWRTADRRDMPLVFVYWLPGGKDTIPISLRVNAVLTPAKARHVQNVSVSNIC